MVRETCVHRCVLGMRGMVLRKRVMTLYVVGAKSYKVIMGPFEASSLSVAQSRPLADSECIDRRALV